MDSRAQVELNWERVYAPAVGSIAAAVPGSAAVGAIAAASAAPKRSGEPVMAPAAPLVFDPRV